MVLLHYLYHAQEIKFYGNYDTPTVVGMYCESGTARRLFRRVKNFDLDSGFVRQSAWSFSDGTCTSSIICCRILC